MASIEEGVEGGKGERGKGGEGGGERVEEERHSYVDRQHSTHISLRDVCGVSTSSKLKGKKQEELVSDSHTLIIKVLPLPPAFTARAAGEAVTGGREGDFNTTKLS